MNKLIITLLLVLVSTACSQLQPTAIENANRGLPAQFSMYSQSAEQANHWWEDFESLELNSLIDLAINENFSVKEAWARLKQAEITAQKEGALLYPKLDYSVGGSYLEQKTKGLPRTKSDNWSTGLTASYEVDLWGKIEADKSNLSLSASATKEDLKSAIMTVSGEIAEAWIGLISTKKQKELFLKQQGLQEKLLELIEFRLPVGKSTALNVYQQRQAIERISAALIPIKSKTQLFNRQLALLTGKASLANLPLQQQHFPLKKEIPAVGLPADLLAARPDIKAAGLRLNAAQWQITAAKADRLPALKLSASHTYSSNEISSLFDNWLLNLAANLTGPIFDGGRRKLEVERTKAVVDERLATYRKIVFTAIKEVEDAMADEDQYTQTLVSLEKQLLLSSKTMQEAKTRYINGSSDFLNVLTEELNNLQLQQDMITAQEKMLSARIKLHKALGGSWVNAITTLAH